MIDTIYITIPGEHPVLDYKMNYSPLVLGFGFLGLNQQHAVCWGILLAVLYLVAIWILCGPCTLRESFLWIFLILSPDSILAVERGNLDLLLFVLMMTALSLRENPYASSLAILSAGLIKFFPIGALVAVWRNGDRKSRLSALLAFAMFLAFLFLLRGSLFQIGTSLTGQYQSAFGTGVFVDLLRHYGIIHEKYYGMIRAGMVALGIAMLILAGVFGLLTSKTTRIEEIPEKFQYSYFLTAPFMLGLFVLGNQMDYKWIFLLLMVPAIRVITRSADVLESAVCKFWVGSVLFYSYWTFFSDEGSLRNALLKQFVMWCIMVATAFLSGRIWKKRV